MFSNGEGTYKNRNTILKSRFLYSFMNRIHDGLTITWIETGRKQTMTSSDVRMRNK